MPQHVPQNLLLQWHITERCNLGCRHCYQAAQPVEELPYTSLLEILRQFTQLLARWRQETDRRIPAQVTLTGGEPFLREDFFELVETLAEQRRAFRFAILTNGTQIDADVARHLRRLLPD